MKVGFYGRLGDMIGREIVLEVAEPLAVGSLRERLAGLYPDAGAELMRPTLRACVGDRMLSDDERLTPSQTVEFFPPFSGG